MPYSVSTSELSKMSEEQRAEAVSKLVQGAFESHNGRRRRIDDEIKQFELKYGITSEQMLKELSEGRLRETDAISDWLWLLNLRGRSTLS